MARSRLVDALRKVAGHPRLMPLTALLLRARTVRPAPAFLLREALRRSDVSIYRLRRSGIRVVIRHGTGDVVTLGELFHEHDYQPPAALQGELGEVRSVIDLGANIGLFGALASALWPRACIEAFEPDPANAAVHSQTIAINGLEPRWRLHRVAAGNHEGSVSFVAGDIALSHIAEPEESAPTIAVPLADVLPRIADADLVKMDIEGGEWQILRDPRFCERPPRAIVLEYHPRFCPEPAPKAAVEAALTGAGMKIQSIWERPDGHGMLWAWRA